MNKLINSLGRLLVHDEGSTGMSWSKHIYKDITSNEVTVSTLGSHSALDICQGAKAEGLRTLVVCERGREKVYAHYFKSRRLTDDVEKGVVDETILLDKFAEITRREYLEELLKRKSIFIPHRSFMVYVPYDAIEKHFSIPIFGNRLLLRAEERTSKPNQYDILEKANIRMPRRFSSPDEIDRLVLVKVPEAKRAYERAFFHASNGKEFKNTASAMLRQGVISEEGLKSATIEEFILGAHFNFNFFYSPLTRELELLGIDTRRQTNLDGLLHLPAVEQLRLPQGLVPKTIEIGHIACTIRESMLEQVFQLGERFIIAVKELYPPGVIGPFALQGAVTPGPPKEEIVVFDVSLRAPGSPGTKFTPYAEYTWGFPISVGRRIAQEVKAAVETDRLEDILT